MTVSDTIILDNLQVEQKIRRIAFQIYESNSNEEEIIIAGIAVQLSLSFYDFNLPLYFFDLFAKGLPSAIIWAAFCSRARSATESRK